MLFLALSGYLCIASRSGDVPCNGGSVSPCTTIPNLPLGNRRPWVIRRLNQPLVKRRRELRKPAESPSPFYPSFTSWHSNVPAHGLLVPMYHL